MLELSERQKLGQNSALDFRETPNAFLRWWWRSVIGLWLAGMALAQKTRVAQNSKLLAVEMPCFDEPQAGLKSGCGSPRGLLFADPEILDSPDRLVGQGGAACGHDSGKRFR